MSQLIKLTRKDIEKRYTGKPILINGEWYIVVCALSHMPLHMLTLKESEMYDEDESSIDGIHVVGKNTENGYCMWINFEKENGWTAYGYH